MSDGVAAEAARPDIHRLAVETAAKLRAGGIAPASVGGFEGWCVWSHRHRTEEWPAPKPGAAPEQAIHSVEACWLAPDGRLCWLSYEEMEKFGWLMHPTPRQGGPWGTNVLGEPSVSSVDDAKLDSVWRFHKSIQRSSSTDELGRETSIFPASLDGFDSLDDLIRQELATLPARAARAAATAAASAGGSGSARGSSARASSSELDLRAPSSSGGWLWALPPLAIGLAALWLVVTSPAATFGVLLWAAPIAFLVLAAVAVVVMLVGLFSGEIGAALAGVIAIPVCLIVVWIGYTIGVVVWQAVADADDHCPKAVAGLPGGPKLCQADYAEGWAPPLFHF